MKNETMTQNAIRTYLQLVGWYVIRNQQGLGSHKGMADLVAVRDGKVVFIEAKTIRGKLSEHQIRFQAEIERHGGTYIIAKSIEDVKNL